MLRQRGWILGGETSGHILCLEKSTTGDGIIAALDVLDNEPQHVENLWKNTDYFRNELQQLGFDTGNSTTPIIPAMCGSAEQAQALSAELLKQDVFAFPIVFPMVARDRARIRVIMNAGLERNDLDEALAAFEAGGKTAGVL